MLTLTAPAASLASLIWRVEAWLLSRVNGGRGRQTTAALSSLDERTLQDIGLHRTTLLSVAVQGIRTLNVS